VLSLHYHQGPIPTPTASDTSMFHFQFRISHIKQSYNLPQEKELLVMEMLVHFMAFSLFFGAFLFSFQFVLTSL
jgi:hypothetical protein